MRRAGGFWTEKSPLDCGRIKASRRPFDAAPDTHPQPTKSNAMPPKVTEAQGCVTLLSGLWRGPRLSGGSALPPAMWPKRALFSAAIAHSGLDQIGRPVAGVLAFKALRRNSQTQPRLASAGVLQRPLARCQALLAALFRHRWLDNAGHSRASLNGRATRCAFPARRVGGA